MEIRETLRVKELCNEACKYYQNFFAIYGKIKKFLSMLPFDKHTQVPSQNGYYYISRYFRIEKMCSYVNIRYREVKTEDEHYFEIIDLSYY